MRIVRRLLFFVASTAWPRLTESSLALANFVSLGRACRAPGILAKDQCYDGLLVLSLLSLSLLYIYIYIYIMHALVEVLIINARCD